MATPLKKIIVCLDYSSKDAEVLENAAVLSRVAGTVEVLFLNVIKDFHLPEQMKKEFPDLIDKAIRERKSELDGLIRAHFKSDLKTRLLVRQGAITKEILKAAAEFKSDLIILGRNDDSHSVLSSRIARRSPCNMLLIPPNRKLKFEKLIVPVDFSDYSELSLKRALQLTENMKSTIYLQNVITVPSSYRYSGKSYEEFGEIIKGHVKKDLDVLLKKVPAKGQKLVSVFTLEHGEHIINLIWNEARKRKVDLIVMGAKGRSSASAIFIGSKAERMIRANREIPLLIIRKKGAIAGLLESIKETLD